MPGMSFMMGMVLSFVGVIEVKTVRWKQGSFLGLGGDASQTYQLCEYKTKSEQTLPVYVQAGWDIPKPLHIDRRLQYGLNNGMIFFVLHDKSQRPYQHRFVMNPVQKWLAFGNDIVKNFGYDLSWIAGDYLHDMA